MSDPMERAWQAARADADSVVLAAPAALRQAGTRRTRVKVMTAAFAAVAVLTGVSIGTSQYFQRAALPMPPGETPSPSTVVSPPPPSPTTEIPAGSPPDPCASDPAKCYAPGRDDHFEKLPAPCTTMQHASDSLITARVSEGRQTFFSDGLGTTQYGHTMTRYRSDGASRYFGELRSALARCSSVTRRNELGQTTTWQYRLAGSNQLGGTESLTVTRTYRKPTDEIGPAREITFKIAVIRFDDVVLVVYDYGWEYSGSPAATFDMFLAESTAEARAWR